MRLICDELLRVCVHFHWLCWFLSSDVLIGEFAHLFSAKLCNKSIGELWKTSLDYWVAKVVNIGVVNSASAISATLRIKTPSLSFWKATNQHGSHYFRRHLRHTEAQTAMAAARPPSISRAMGNSPSQIFLKAVHDQVGSCCCSLVASPPPRRFISVQKWKLCPELV